MSKVLLFLSWWLALSSFAGAAELIPRPQFTAKRDFFIGTSEAARSLPGMPMPAFAFEKSLQACSLDATSVDDELRVTLSPLSQFTSSVQAVFPYFTANSLKDLRLLIDFYGDRTREFRSFYLPPQNTLPATISLDCTPSSHTSWTALLSHETVHHLNHNKNLAPWVDEMLAQVVETRAAGDYPTMRLEGLREEATTPSFFAREKVFKTSQQYAVNMLFGLYVSQIFHGSEVFQLVSADVRTLSEMTVRLRKFSESKNEFDYIRPYLTPRGLIRHFALALNLQQPLLNNRTIYQVPGWRGFVPNTETSKPGRYVVEPGGSLRLSVKWRDYFLGHDKNSVVDVYRILKKPGVFKIANADEAVEGSWTEDYLLLVNGSETEFFEVDLS